MSTQVAPSSPIRLGEDSVTLLRQASQMMGEALDRARATTIALVSEGEGESDRLEVPPQTLKVLAQVLALMARERAFVLYPEEQELTTNEAARLIGVSRPYLCKLIDAGSLGHRLVGRHRRILLREALSYRDQMRKERKAGMDDLVKTSEDAGLYDL